MNKKKSIVCTTLFAIIIISVYVSTMFIKSHFGFSLYEVVAPIICGLWIGERIKKFYSWLMTEEI